MKRTVLIDVECEKATCYDKENKKRCQFEGAVKFGTLNVCRLFPDQENSHTVLKFDDDFGLMRCDDCLKATGDYIDVKVCGL